MATMSEPRPCPECCEHGVGLVWFCTWCAEAEEFGTSDFGVWGAEMVLPCEHRRLASGETLAAKSA
jgi:hypothetical protein